MNGPAHGQVWWADLPGGKVRPVMILTRGSVALRLRRVLVAPVTTTVRGIRTEVPLGRPEGVREGSVANLDNSQLLGVERLLARAGSLAADRWPQVCAAMSHVLGCRSRGLAG